MKRISAVLAVAALAAIGCESQPAPAPKSAPPPMGTATQAAAHQASMKAAADAKAAPEQKDEPAADGKKDEPAGDAKKTEESTEEKKDEAK